MTSVFICSRCFFYALILRFVCSFLCLRCMHPHPLSHRKSITGSTQKGEERRKRGSCRPFREPQKDPSWNGVDWQRYGTAVRQQCHNCLFKPGFCILQPFFSFFGHLKQFLQLNLLVKAVTKRQLGTDDFFFPFQAEHLKTNVYFFNS